MPGTGGSVGVDFIKIVVVNSIIGANLLDNRARVCRPSSLEVSAVVKPNVRTEGREASKEPDDEPRPSELDATGLDARPTDVDLKGPAPEARAESDDGASTDGEDSAFELLLRRAAAPPSGPEGSGNGGEGPAHSFRPGEVIAGRYRVEEVIGRGGMGLVLRAQDTTLGRVVAIKTMLPRAMGSPEARKRFDLEARAAVKLRSEHAIRLYDVGLLPDGTPYHVLELLEGEDLATLLQKKGCLPIADAITYVSEACEAVQEAHSLGIIHRDLKPANLFLTTRPDGSAYVKVVDFGLAKAAAVPIGGAAGSHSMTQRAPLGTPRNMAPEQIEDPRNVDARTDVWGLGTVLFELITGHSPFSGADLPELFAHILHGQPSPMSSPDAPIPSELERIVKKCLEKSPAARYPSAAALLEDLAVFAISGRRSAKLDSVTKKPVPAANGILIAHAAKDGALADSMAVFLRTAMGLRKEDVQCIALDSPAGGSEVARGIRTQCQEAIVVLALFSQSSLSSPWMFVQLGARWDSGRPLFAVLGPDTRPQQLKAPVTDWSPRRIDRLDELDRLLQDIAASLGLEEHIASEQRTLMNTFVRRQRRRLRLSRRKVAALLITAFVLVLSGYGYRYWQVRLVRVAGSGTVIQGVLKVLPSDTPECDGLRFWGTDVGSLDAIPEILRNHPGGDVAVMSVRVSHQRGENDSRMYSDPHLRGSTFIEVALVEDEIGWYVHRDNPVDAISRKAARALLFGAPGESPPELWRDLGVPANHPLAQQQVELILPRACKDTSGTCAVVAAALREDRRESIQPAGQKGRSREEISSLTRDVGRNEHSIGFVSNGLDDGTAKRIRVLSQEGGRDVTLSFRRHLWAYVYLPEEGIRSATCNLLRCVISASAQGVLQDHGWKALPQEVQRAQSIGLGWDRDASCKIDRDQFHELRLGDNPTDAIVLENKVFSALQE